MRKADCIRYYGSNASTQTIQGTVISSKREASRAGGSLRTIVTVDYYFDKGDIRRKYVPLQSIIAPLKDPPSQAPELPALVNTPMGVVEVVTESPVFNDFAERVAYIMSNNDPEAYATLVDEMLRDDPLSDDEKLPATN
jgi:hypothetical protein